MDRKGDLYLCGRPWWFLLFSGPSGKSRGFSGDRNLCGLSDKPGNKGKLKPRCIWCCFPHNIHFKSSKLFRIDWSAITIEYIGFTCSLNDNLQGIYFHSSLCWIKVTSPWHLSPQFDKGLNLDSDSLTFNHRAFKLNCLWGNCSAVFLKFTLFPSCGKEKRKPKGWGRICVYKDHDLISIRYPILQPQQGS